MVSQDADKYQIFYFLSRKEILIIENNEDSESAIMSMRWLVKKAIEQCDDMELLDLVYRILVFDITEGRAD